MTRIVGGQARGRRLAVPPRGTRPTSERAREALFNTLRSELELTGTRVLDLYAGSGAVGLEALSRGAAAAVFVESDRRAATVLQENIAALRLREATVHRCTVASFLGAADAGEPFDLVFLDPPYAVPSAEVGTLLATLAEDRWLVPGGVVVVERSHREPQSPWPNEIKAIKQRRYGEGCLWYGRRE